jgi:predicted Zn-dependent protease with MMP-like domain
MEQHHAGGNFVHVLPAVAAGADKGFFDLGFAHAERGHALRELFFFFEADGKCAHAVDCSGSLRASQSVVETCGAMVAIVMERKTRQNFRMDMDWEKLCAVASAEVEKTLAALPKPLRERAEKLPVTFERQPNADLQADGIEADTLGLFTGPDFADEENVPMPPQIILFLENIWDVAETDEKLFREEVRTTFLHELGHYLGLDEDELTERGLE